MEPAKSTTMPVIPELSASDLQWLHETIGIGAESLSDDVLKTADYVQTIERHLDDNPERRLSDKNPQGNTALHLVSISENYAAIAALLVCGADANETNDRGQTPVTYSHHCPDYGVGFQFYRHLHKLAFLGQRLHGENRVWMYDVGETYDKRYPRYGRLTAFLHNPALTTEDISRVLIGGERAVCGMYETELQNMRNTRVKKRGKLDKMANVVDENLVAGNRLKYIRSFTRRRAFHLNFPLFGCVVMLKYRQSLHAVNSCDLEKQDERQLVDESQYASGLRNEDEQRMEGFMAREDTAMAGLMNELRINERRRSAGSSGQSEVSVDNCCGDEKLERMRRNLAKLPGRRP